MSRGRPGLAVAVTLLLAACASSEPRPPVDLSASARLNTQMGVEYLHRSRDDLAEPKLLRALEQDPQHAPAHAAYALWLHRNGRPDQADAHYSQALRLVGDDGLIRNNYGVFLCEQGRVAEGLDQLHAAARVAAEADGGHARRNIDTCLQNLDADTLRAGFQAALRLGDTVAADAWRRQLDGRVPPSAPFFPASDTSTPR